MGMFGVTQSSFLLPSTITLMFHHHRLLKSLMMAFEATFTLDFDSLSSSFVTPLVFRRQPDFGSLGSSPTQTNPFKGRFGKGTF